MKNNNAGSEEPRQIALKSIAGLDKTIHEPGRLAIMSFLFVVDEADFIFLLDQTGLTRGNLSSHMSKLEKAGYVEVDKMFIKKIPRTTYHLSEPGRQAYLAYRSQLLESIQEFH